MASGCRDCKHLLEDGMCSLHPYARPPDPQDFSECWYPVEAKWYPKPEPEKVT